MTDQPTAVERLRAYLDRDTPARGHRTQETVDALDALAEVERGMAQLAEAKADSRRLDWLCSHDASIMRGGIIERRKGNDPDAYYIEWIERESGDIVTQSCRFADYRQAIDEAMQQGGESDENPSL